MNNILVKAATKDKQIELLHYLVTLGVRMSGTPESWIRIWWSSHPWVVLFNRDIPIGMAVDPAVYANWGPGYLIEEGIPTEVYGWLNRVGGGVESSRSI